MIVRRTLIALVGVLLLAGCRTTGTAINGQFPALWPARAPLTLARPAAGVDRGTGIAVAVAPWTWPGAAETGGALTTTEALTQMTEAALRHRGFEVVQDSAASYRLACTVRDLTYTIQPGYPGERHYLASVSCQLLGAADGQMLWQRDFEERVDETLYVNTYTRLPAHHERAFARECLPALLERITDSLLHAFHGGLSSQSVAAQQSAPTVPVVDTK